MKTYVRSIVADLVFEDYQRDTFLVATKVLSLVLEDGVQSVELDVVKKWHGRFWPQIGAVVDLKMDVLPEEVVSPWRVPNLGNVALMYATDLTIKANTIKDNRDFIKFMREKTGQEEISSYTNEDLVEYVSKNFDVLDHACERAFSDVEKFRCKEKERFAKFLEKRDAVVAKIGKEGESALDDLHELALDIQQSFSKDKLLDNMVSRKKDKSNEL